MNFSKKCLSLIAGSLIFGSCWGAGYDFSPTILGFVKLNKTTYSQLKKNIPKSCAVSEKKVDGNLVYRIQNNCFNLAGNPKIGFTIRYGKVVDVMLVMLNPDKFLYDEYKAMLTDKYSKPWYVDNEQPPFSQWDVENVEITLMSHRSPNMLTLSYRYQGKDVDPKYNKKKESTRNLL